MDLPDPDEPGEDQRRPIADHALLSDCHSSALVDTSGSVQWLTFPRFDSPSVMAGLLDDKAGHWAIRPAGDFDSTRRYLDQTMMLETTFHTPTGTAPLTDALAMGPDNSGHRLGKDVPHILLRSLTCTSGQVDIDVSYAPRPEYGLIVPLLSHVEGGVTARGGAEWLVLSTPVDLTLAPVPPRVTPGWAAGQTLRFALSTGRRWRRRRRARGGRRCRGPPRPHHRGLAVVVGAAPELRRTLA